MTRQHPSRHPATHLRDIALARSGDKGHRATLSIIALDSQDFARLDRLLTTERLLEVYAAAPPVGLGLPIHRIDRYALPQLGVTRSLALDAHGKTLSAWVLALPLPPD
ncbi:MAG: AtuA-related protein [Rubrivivax sp.]